MANHDNTPSSENEEEFWNLDHQDQNHPDNSETSEDDSIDEELEELIEQPTPTPETLQVTSDSEPPRTKSSLVEKTAIAAVCLFLVALGIGYYAYFLNKYDTSDQRDYLTNTPVKGEYANIESIETAWTKANSDNVRLGVKLVPSATIQLAEEGTTSGKLRVVFYSMEKNNDGSLKSAGDSVTIPFENGKFSNGETSFLVSGSDGLETMGDFYSYRNQDEKRWIVEVREAHADSRKYKPLANAPIDPILAD